MKLICFILALIGSIASVSSQTFNEWFKQKKTQTQYLLQQVAALHVYINHAQRGYQIVNKGLTTICDLKDGHLRLDDAFFRAMDIVSPSVKGYDKIAAIVSLELQVVEQYRFVMRQVTTGGQYTGKEKHYVLGVLTSVVYDCAVLLDILMAVIADNVFQMNDDERIRRIDQLYTDMREAHAFVIQFKNQCGIMALQRAKDDRDVRLLKKLYAYPIK